VERARVRWFNKHFGYGFIRNYEGEDVFVHHSVVDVDESISKDCPAYYRPAREFKFLVENEMVEFDCVRENGRLKATKVQTNVPKKTWQFR
jgi:cold shock CspA family protein